MKGILEEKRVNVTFGQSFITTVTYVNLLLTCNAPA